MQGVISDKEELICHLIKSENGKTYLVPAIKKFVPVIDIDNKKIIIDPIEGMIE